jgi:hypothetical protein
MGLMRIEGMYGGASRPRADILIHYLLLKEHAGKMHALCIVPVVDID